MAILIYFLLVLINPYIADSLSFDFPNISPLNQNTDIVTTGDAFVTTDGMQLIPYKNESGGRGIYYKSLHIWDKTSGELASFSTNFSFVIESATVNEIYAYGLTFFLAENNSVTTSDATLGLPIVNSSNTKLYPFVAVEFDTFWNKPWDPIEISPNRHVGINVNSLNSSVFKKWSINITKGAHCRASVTYNSVSENFSVSVVTNDVNRVIDLNYIIDLRKVLPEWVIFGFSATGGQHYFEKITVLSWSFSSSNLQVDEQTESPRSPPQAPKKRAGHKVGLIAGLVVVVPSFLAILVFCYIWRKIRYRITEKRNHKKLTKDLKKGTGPKEFSYRDIDLATDSFASKNKLGEGGFGQVYKGVLKDAETYIAVKRVSETSQQGIKEYTAEVEIISQLRHKNLVELKGWCHEKSKLLLIYEYMENRSLDLHLFKQESKLTWDKRKRIADGLACALSYLHEECRNCILHRDIKSSNVMLDSDFNAKLGDFGLAKLVDHDKSSERTKLAGTLGYMAPEYGETGKASKESDVYSFGVVALEIACGRKAIEYEAPERLEAPERPVVLVKWVRDFYETGNIEKAADPSLGSDNKEQIERLMTVGLWCAHPLADQRPSMRQANQVLNYEAPLPKLSKLASKMPEITSYAPPNPPVVYYTMRSKIITSSSSSHSSTPIPSKLPTSAATSSTAALLGG